MKKRYQYEKSLFYLRCDGVTIRISCQHNINTNYNSITTRFGYQNNGGYNNNRTCSMFLGVHIAEQILSKVFKNVEMMPIANPGYDFICNNGYKIDVKSSCIHSDGVWSFEFGRNKIPDYFLCIAFDDRDNLQPQYVWLIPCGIVNNLTGTSISKSTLDKWSEYEQPMDKVILCCDNMKNGDL